MWTNEEWAEKQTAIINSCYYLSWNSIPFQGIKHTYMHTPVQIYSFGTRRFIYEMLVAMLFDVANHFPTETNMKWDIDQINLLKKWRRTENSTTVWQIPRACHQSSNSRLFCHLSLSLSLSLSTSVYVFIFVYIVYPFEWCLPMKMPCK